MRRHLDTGEHVAEATALEIRMAATALEQDGDRAAAHELMLFLNARRQMLGWVRTDVETGEELYRAPRSEFDRILAALKKAIDGLPEPFTVRQVEQSAYHGRPGFTIDKMRRPFTTEPKGKTDAEKNV